MTNPAIATIGGITLRDSGASAAKVGWATGPAGVKVGKRVGVTSPRLNWAARVGSMVALARGVAVGGG